MTKSMRDTLMRKDRRAEDAAARTLSLAAKHLANANRLDEATTVLEIAQTVIAQRIETQRALRSPEDNPPCGSCGGPHPFDTVVPSVVWNAVVRAKALSEYLCTTCIVREFAKAGLSFTATLWGGDFHGLELELRIGGQAAEDAARISEENTALRAELTRKALKPETSTLQ